MSSTIHAPWTPEQVAALKTRQADSRRHPYTCPGRGAAGTAGTCKDRKLIPTIVGWVCACGGYAQNWAHDPDIT